MTQEEKEILMKDYHGFIITEWKYIEKSHPQYNYLGFMAENNIGQHIEVVFHDIDMRCKTHDELLDIFLKRVERFIDEINKDNNTYKFEL